MCVSLQDAHLISFVLFFSSLTHIPLRANDDFYVCFCCRAMKIIPPGADMPRECECVFFRVRFSSRLRKRLKALHSDNVNAQ